MGGLKESIEAMFDSTTRIHGAEQVLDSSDVARRMSPSSRAQRLLDMTPGDGSKGMIGEAGGSDEGEGIATKQPPVQVRQNRGTHNLAAGGGGRGEEERLEAEVLGGKSSIAAAGGGGGGDGGGGKGGAGVELLEAEILRLTQEGERMCEKLVLAEEEAKRSEEKVRCK
jgi:hypothetical protein